MPDNVAAIHLVRIERMSLESIVDQFSSANIELVDIRMHWDIGVMAIRAAIAVVYKYRSVASDHIVGVALLRWPWRGHGVDLGRELAFRSTTRRRLID
ncbi:hypothetical protein GCM10010399_20970 [Dactylosporangium fulvum]|uniref:Uncharacterized protein n=1 Tax=Dactylosporangium fulvum TaxID=53359 RepID=A0ABY5W3Y8_9ACTN|nr:hypothetical protein [Dactylosporangium fulvum]UWP84788.1 hypothetical protein Dfulv_11380 [Dactylosporangium fulvum]